MGTRDGRDSRNRPVEAHGQGSRNGSVRQGQVLQRGKFPIVFAIIGSAFMVNARLIHLTLNRKPTVAAPLLQVNINSLEARLNSIWELLFPSYLHPQLDWHPLTRWHKLWPPQLEIALS